MSEIVVVGSLNMDLVVGAPHLPTPGETLLGRNFQMVPGGKGANQAVAAARLGAWVAIVGRVGVDDFGRALRLNLDAAGVDDQYVLNDDSAATGVAVIEVDDNGQNTIVVAPGTNANVSRLDVSAARSVISSARTLVAQLEVPLDTVAYALAMARAAGVLTVLNPAPAQPLAADILSLADILVPNETEATLLTGIPVRDLPSAEAAARELNRQGAQVVVITLGARGALVLENGTAKEVPPFPVRAVDTTAAGDAFVAALAVARTREHDLNTALREASAAGALAATRAGAQPSLPTRVELTQFLKTVS